jgi:hypothetical protein
MHTTGDVVQENQIANFESEKLNSQLAVQMKKNELLQSRI